MRRPSRETRKNADQGNQPQPIESPDITLGRDQIDENRLHPTPIPGINLLEPNLELVDPSDWFLQPIRGNNIELGGIDFTVSDNGCMICVSVRGTLGWLTASEGNGVGFCYIKPECRKEPPPPPPPPGEPPGLPTKENPLLLPAGEYILTREILWKSETSPLCSGGAPIEEFSETGYGSGHGLTFRSNSGFSVYGTKESVSFPPGGAFSHFYKCDPRKPWEWKYSENNTYLVIHDQDDPVAPPGLSWSGITVASFSGAYNGKPGLNVSSYITTNWKFTRSDGEVYSPENDDDNNNNDEQPPPKPPENDKMACCRNQTNSDALLRKIAKCVGTHQLPATMPESFNRLVNGTTRISTIPEFQQWLGVQLSDLIGEFPKKIKIKDASLLEDGDQGVEIELMNLSEAIADMYGTSVRGTAVNEVLMAFATRMAVEICSVKAATLVGQSYSKATALALGYKMEEEKELIPFGFNLTADAEKLEDFLENTEKKITVWKCKEPSSAWEYLERLMYVAGLIKAKTLRKESSTIDDTINRIVDSGFLTGDKFDNFVNKLKETGFYNLDGTMRKPDVEEI
jgi:hypothetical protein